MPDSPLPLIIALDNVRSLHNVGAIFRTADALHVEKVLLGGITPVPPRDEICKTALGTVETVAWEYAPALLPVLKNYQTQGYTLYALELTPTAHNILTTPLRAPAIFIFGHERLGVSSDILACTEHLMLPMRGTGTHSLNVASTVAAASYQFLRTLSE